MSATSVTKTFSNCVNWRAIVVNADLSLRQYACN